MFFCCRYFPREVVCCVQISVGDFVAVKPDDPTVPLYIGKVVYLYQTAAEKLSKDQRMAHIMWFKSVLCCCYYYVTSKLFIVA